MTAPTCPRCRRTVDLTAFGIMKPHRDTAVDAPCPMGGLTIGEAADKIDAERARVGLPPLAVTR